MQCPVKLLYWVKMKTEVPTRPSVDNGSRQSTELIIFGTVADTTWRMFVPVIGGALAGYFIDRSVGSRPVGVISGMFIGVVLAVALVVMQYRQTTGKRGKE